MATMRIFTVVVMLGILSSASFFDSVDAQKIPLLFAFGDSYADVGNTPRSGPNISRSYEFPYGITWPEFPAGRFCDGKNQMDWLANYVGLKGYPPPYFYSAGQDTSMGVNFAVAGSGVTPAYNPITLGVQVDNFELFLRTDPYSKAALANSLTLVSVVGNDYLAFTGNTSAELFQFVQTVVNAVQANLQRLYDLGLRNVMVSNIFEGDCTPEFTYINGYTKCTGAFGPFEQIHNAFLLGVVQSLNAYNPGARFIILDQYSAFAKIIATAKSDGFSMGLAPCCTGITPAYYCANVDPKTNHWLYTVCKRREKAIFWDNFHPTMWAWNYIINLYWYEPGYILLANEPTLRQWLGFIETAPEPVPAPMPSPNVSTGLGEFQAALNFLLPASNYSEAIGLLNSVNPETIFSNSTPTEGVTIFLPSNNALQAPSAQPFIDRIFAENLVDQVAVYQLVVGFYDLNTLVTKKPTNVTSISGLKVPLTYNATGIFVGTNPTAKVIDPNLYLVPNEIVVHGIDHLLVPPGV